jgi:hypothetical protein
VCGVLLGLETIPRRAHASMMTPTAAQSSAD